MIFEPPLPQTVKWKPWVQHSGVREIGFNLVSLPFFTERWLTCFVAGTLSKPCGVCIGMKGSIKISDRYYPAGLASFVSDLIFTFWHRQYLDSHSQGGLWRFHLPFSQLIFLSPIETQHQVARNRKHGHLSRCPELTKPAYSWIVATNAMFRCHMESLLLLSLQESPLRHFPCNLSFPLSYGAAHPLLPPLFHNPCPSYNQHLHHFNPFDPHPVCFPVSTAPGDYILTASSPLCASVTVAAVGWCMQGS